MNTNSYRIYALALAFQEGYRGQGPQKRALNAEAIEWKRVRTDREWLGESRRTPLLSLWRT